MGRIYKLEAKNGILYCNGKQITPENCRIDSLSSDGTRNYTYVHIESTVANTTTWFSGDIILHFSLRNKIYKKILLCILNNISINYNYILFNQDNMIFFKLKATKELLQVLKQKTFSCEVGCNSDLIGQIAGYL